MAQTKKGVAFVTGASQGIGATLARGLVEDGFDVALFARSRDRLEGLKRELSSGQGQVEIFPCDLSVEAEAEGALARAMATFEQCSLLINNAGTSFVGTLEASYEDFQEVLRINLLAPFLFCKRLVPLMKAARRGQIINVSSVRGKAGAESCGLYAASKFALLGFSESLYHELAPQGIKVTALCPSWVNTPMAAAIAPFPVEQMIPTDDLMSVVRFLLSLSPHACPKEIVLEQI